MGEREGESKRERGSGEGEKKREWSMPGPIQRRAGFDDNYVIKKIIARPVSRWCVRVLPRTRERSLVRRKEECLSSRGTGRSLSIVALRNTVRNNISACVNARDMSKNIIGIISVMLRTHGMKQNPYISFSLPSCRVLCASLRLAREGVIHLPALHLPCLFA